MYDALKFTSSGQKTTAGSSSSPHTLSTTTAFKFIVIAVNFVQDNVGHRFSGCTNPELITYADNYQGIIDYYNGRTWTVLAYIKKSSDCKTLSWYCNSNVTVNSAMLFY